MQHTRRPKGRLHFVPLKGPTINTNGLAKCTSPDNMASGVEDWLFARTVWAKNLTDEDYNTFGINYASLGPITSQYGIGTSYGLDVTYEF